MKKTPVLLFAVFLLHLLSLALFLSLPLSLFLGHRRGPLLRSLFLCLLLLLLDSDLHLLRLQARPQFPQENTQRTNFLLLLLLHSHPARFPSSPEGKRCPSNPDADLLLLLPPRHLSSSTLSTWWG